MEIQLGTLIIYSIVIIIIILGYAIPRLFYVIIMTQHVIVIALLKHELVLIVTVLFNDELVLVAFVL